MKEQRFKNDNELKSFFIQQSITQKVELIKKNEISIKRLVILNKKYKKQIKKLLEKKEGVEQ